MNSALKISGFALGVLSSAVGYYVWRRANQPDLRPAPAAAFAGDGAHKGAFVNTRDAGPDNMRDAEEDREWDCTDEASDASFPSSDPPSVNDFTAPEPIDYSPTKH